MVVMLAFSWASTLPSLVLNPDYVDFNSPPLACCTGCSEDQKFYLRFSSALLYSNYMMAKGQPIWCRFLTRTSAVKFAYRELKKQGCWSSDRFNFGCDRLTFLGSNRHQRHGNCLLSQSMVPLSYCGNSVRRWDLCDVHQQSPRSRSK